VRERHKTPTSYDSPIGRDDAALIELANFLYSEYEEYLLDNQLGLVDDEDDGSPTKNKEAS
jgi:hypothetical protein